MNIYINTKELSTAIRDAFYAEAVAVPTEIIASRSAGLITEGEFMHAMTKADSAVRAAIDRFLVTPGSAFANATPSLPENLCYNIIGTPRRLAGRQQVLADFIHDALKELALAALFFSILPESAAKHATASADTLTQLRSTLITKKPPIPRF